MKRISIEPRANWQQKCEAVGFHFYNMYGQAYWYESACYHFGASEINELEVATQNLQELYIEAAERIIQQDRFSQLCIPPEFAELCRKSWERDDPSLYGRFDLAYDGVNPPKLLEYNADTPTALLETAVVQWTWLEEMFPEADQFNSVHEKLLAAFEEMNGLAGETLYFSCEKETLEDLGTVEYLRDLAIQAGLNSQHIYIDDIGWSEDLEVFCDLDNQIISHLFKLYPWEWMMREKFGQYLLLEPMKLIEPAWKLIWSNKAILPILWEFFPEHPNLLPAYFDSGKLSHPYLSKPVFSREGGNITVYFGDREYQTEGIYEDEPLIYQSYYQLPNFDGYYPIVGAWVIGGETAGICLREDREIVTQDLSRFVPHYFS
ncbi:glutathionylspermidine synthase family protein [Dapis sp. BLCC M126]|uniref:glutathionylspermidine synthase family protein n=1 Tax=Dapis sp. BLCC M126 TaxID=3400189 RepID=UPI003CE8C8A4